MLQNCYCMCDHFGTSDPKGLTEDLKILNFLFSFIRVWPGDKPSPVHLQTDPRALIYNLTIFRSYLNIRITRITPYINNENSRTEKRSEFFFLRKFFWPKFGVVRTFFGPKVFIIRFCWWHQFQPMEWLLFILFQSNLSDIDLQIHGSLPLEEWLSLIWSHHVQNVDENVF